MTKNPTSQITFGDKVYKLTWIRDDEITQYDPIKQVYGIVFNESDEILICRESSDSNWQIPGGSPEEGESLETTLIRELQEEVNVEVDSIMPLGVQKVEEENSPKSTYYQARFVAHLSNMKEITPDPDTDNTWERDFVPFEKINEYVQWGDLGVRMFRDAKEVYQKEKPN